MRFGRLICLLGLFVLTSCKSKVEIEPFAAMVIMQTHLIARDYRNVDSGVESYAICPSAGWPMATASTSAI